MSGSICCGCDGQSLTSEPWTARREQLDALVLAGDAWSVPPAHVGDGAVMLEAARGQGVDALIAKRTTSKYQPGEQSKDWLKIPT